MSRCLRLLAVATLPALGGVGVAQPFPQTPPDQRWRVAGWTVEHSAESDGGRIVRLTREGPGIRLEYRAVFWRGNYGIYMHSSAERPGLACGSASWRQPWRTAASAATVRERLAGHLAECDTPPGRISAALLGFERAYAVAARSVAEAEALTEAEIRAIENYGAGDSQ